MDHSNWPLGNVIFDPPPHTYMPYPSTTPSSEGQSFHGLSISDTNMSTGPGRNTEFSSDSEEESTYDAAMSSVLLTRPPHDHDAGIAEPVKTSKPPVINISRDPTSLLTEPTYTCVPLTEQELGMKGRALQDLIAERYGPPDFPDAKYGYV